ncbi:MAG: zinc ribbon domain-containing protein [Herpetosiphonaceae bacterium]|nr:zinc ribbon domain-containing protein [Herpetosiphonaceae bacterium]
MSSTITDLLKPIGIVLGGYYLLLLVAAAIWTYRDIRARTQDVIAQVLSVTLVLVLQLPFGLPLYLLMRPKQTLADKYERALEEEYLRRDIEDEHVCPNCQRGIEGDFVVCPYCMVELRRRCVNCDRTIDLTWGVCPYCATVPGGVPRIPLPATDKTRELALNDA